MLNVSARFAISAIIAFSLTQIAPSTAKASDLEYLDPITELEIINDFLAVVACKDAKAPACNGDCPEIEIPIPGPEKKKKKVKQECKDLVVKCQCVPVLKGIGPLG